MGIDPEGEVEGEVQFFPPGKVGGSSWRKHTVRRSSIKGFQPWAEKAQRRFQAVDFINMGQLSAARHALDGAPIALGNDQTLNSLCDPERRPTVPRAPLPSGVLHHIPDEEIDLDQERFMANLRSVHHGAAGGPSGMTAEHLKVVLESEQDS